MKVIQPKVDKRLDGAVERLQRKYHKLYIGVNRK